MIGHLNTDNGLEDLKIKSGREPRKVGDVYQDVPTKIWKKQWIALMV